MKRVGVQIFLVFASVNALADAELIVRADETLAHVKPNASEQTWLPTLEFSVHAQFACRDGAVAESITISVADAHERHVPDADQKALHTTVTVPRNQIASVTTGDFCADADNAGELLLAGVAMAQVSLRCRNEDSSAVSYASLGLPLRLVCDQDPSVEEVSAAPR